MVLKKKGVRSVPKHDWRSEPEDPPVTSVEDTREGRPDTVGNAALARAKRTDEDEAREADTLPPPPDTEPDAVKDAERSVSGVRAKGTTQMPPAATIDEVTADLRRDSRRED